MTPSDKTRGGGSRISRRTVVKLAVLAPAAAALNACGFNGQSPAARSTPQEAADGARATAQGGASGARARARTLTVASFYPVDQTSGWDTLVKGFKEIHPDVDVRAQYTPGEEYITKLLAQKASNTMPDVLGVENTPFPRFVASGLLQDLTPRLENDKDFNRDDFFPKLMDRYTSEGKVYGVPYDAQPVVGVFINKKLFEDGGVPVPTNEWSWEDMLQAAKTLTKQQGNRTSQFGLDPGGNWTNWVYAHGGRLVDDYQKPTEVVIDSPEAIAGMRSYVDLFQEQKVSPSPQLLESGGLTSADLFTTGQVAMFHGGYWELVFQPDKFTGLDLGYVMLPVGPSRERAFATGGTCYSVSAGTKDPDLAYEFVKFFMGMPGWKAAAAAAQAIYPPAHIPSYKEVFMAEPDSPVENKDINGQGAEYAIFQPADPAWPEINTKYIAPDVDLMVRGQKPVEETLKGWAERFTPMLTANK